MNIELSSVVFSFCILSSELLKLVITIGDEDGNYSGSSYLWITLGGTAPFVNFMPFLTLPLSPYNKDKARRALSNGYRRQDLARNFRTVSQVGLEVMLVSVKVQFLAKEAVTIN